MEYTPKIVERTYAYLRGLPPFDGMSLPPPDKILFRVGKSRKYYGHTRALVAWPGGKLFELVITGKTSFIEYLVRVVAHEMCHIYADLRGEKADHCMLWHFAADQVCHHMGFDRKEF